MDGMVEEMRETNECLPGLEQNTRQLRLAMGTDGQADTKICERTEGAATAVQAMHGGSCSANWVDPNPMCSTSFGGDSTGRPALPCSRDDVLVGNGTAATKSCLSPLKMRSPTAVNGSLPTGKTSTATKTTLHQLSLRFCLTEATNLTTSTIYVSYFSSFGWINNQQAPFWPRVIRTKSGQNRMFDSGGSKGRLRACLFLGAWCAFIVLERLLAICSVFWQEE